MKILSKCITLLCSLLLATTTIAQISPLSVIDLGTGIGKGIAGNIKNKKKVKNIQSSISQVEINGQIHSVLRVPEEKIISDAKVYIVKVQNQLDQYYKLYKENSRIDLPSYNDDIVFLKSTDNDWPVEYYKAEWDEYKIFDQQLAKREKWVKDSLEIVARMQRKKTEDSLALLRKQYADSIEYSNRTHGYHFVNTEFALIKEKPSDKSKTMGRLFVGSYLKVLGYSDNSPFLKIRFQDIEGFINKNDIVDNIDKINVLNAAVTTYKSRQYYKYEPNYEYVPEQTNTASTPLNFSSSSSGTRSSSASSTKRTSSKQRSYITGPRGGCYYLTASGNKVYVDRSYCQ